MAIKFTYEIHLAKTVLYEHRVLHSKLLLSLLWTLEGINKCCFQAQDEIIDAGVLLGSFFAILQPPPHTHTHFCAKLKMCIKTGGLNTLI